MVNTKLFKDIIEKSGLKISFIAKESGMSRATLSKIINNHRFPTNLEIDRICKVLRIKDKDVMMSIFFANHVDKIVNI